MRQKQHEGGGGIGLKGKMSESWNCSGIGKFPLNHTLWPLRPHSAHRFCDVSWRLLEDVNTLLFLMKKDWNSHAFNSDQPSVFDLSCIEKNRYCFDDVIWTSRQRSLTGRLCCVANGWIVLIDRVPVLLWTWDRSGKVSYIPGISFNNLEENHF